LLHSLPAHAETVGQHLEETKPFPNASMHKATNHAQSLVLTPPRNGRDCGLHSVMWFSCTWSQRHNKKAREESMMHRKGKVVGPAKSTN